MSAWPVSSSSAPGVSALGGVLRVLGMLGALGVLDWAPTRGAPTDLGALGVLRVLGALYVLGGRLLVTRGAPTDLGALCVLGALGVLGVLAAVCCMVAGCVVGCTGVCTGTTPSISAWTCWLSGTGQGGNGERCEGEMAILIYRKYITALDNTGSFIWTITALENRTVVFV
jgi:hypothetical protein